MADINVEIAKLQKEIYTKLGLNSDQVVFDFTQDDGVTSLNLITINPRHDQSFLYYSVKAIDKKEALEKVLAYVEGNEENENTYTIQWQKDSVQELHTSYFRAKNMYGALDKFFYNREINSFTIFSIALNPVA